MSDFDIKITKENRKWLDNLGLNHPLLIAGPCSAETEEQVFNIARCFLFPSRYLEASYKTRYV